MMVVLRYHRAGHGHWARAILELVLAVVFLVVLSAIAIGITERAFGVKKLTELAPDVHAYVSLVYLAALGPASLLAALATKRSPNRLISVQGIVRWRWLATCVAVGVAIQGVPTLLGVLGIVAHPSRFVGWREYAPLLGVVVALVPLQAIGEELFFRGTVMQVVGSFAKSPVPAVAISAALFALGHGLRPEVFVPMVVVGLCTAWITLRTGGLEASTAYHATLNVTIFALRAATGRVKPHSNATAHWGNAAISIAIVLVFTAIVANMVRSRLAASGQHGITP